MQLDKAVIPHHIIETIPFNELMELVKVNPTYLDEKKTWYRVNGSLEYFKKRDDLRIFTELFFQKYASVTIGLDSLIYRLAYIRDRDRNTQQVSNTSILGLLSTNFQTASNNYYLVSELLNSDCSDLCHYGGFSLVTLLKFFKDYVATEEYQNIKNFLIRLFIIDGLLLQVDRNEHNICFEISEIPQLSHTKRLRPQILVRDFPNNSKFLEKSGSLMKLRGLKPSKVYDNERILNIDHNDVFIYNPRHIWTPIFPFTERLKFKTFSEAQTVSKEQYEGLDPNLTELYLSYYAECKNFFEQLAYDDVYRKILEGYSKPNDPVSLQASEREKIENTILGRQKEFKNILRLG